MTLTEFLLARIAEDEAVRVAVIGHRAYADGLDIEVQRFNAWFCPARLRVEGEAKRRIIELHTRTEPDEHECAGDFTGYSLTDPELSPCLTMLLLASVYAWHDDYMPEWASDTGETPPKVPRLVSPTEGATIERHVTRLHRWPRWSKLSWF